MELRLTAVAARMIQLHGVVLKIALDSLNVR